MNALLGCSNVIRSVEFEELAIRLKLKIVYLPFFSIKLTFKG